MERCGWCLINEQMTQYHDEEWGIPLYDDRKQFEFLMMEVMQCGLNWNMMLQKREIFHACFSAFDYEAVARYGEGDIERILNTPGMIRFMEIRKEFLSFSRYIWGFTGGKICLYEGHDKGELPARNKLSDQISGDLKRRGFKYLGSITVYSHLQACGIINDHTADCFRYKQLLEDHAVIRLKGEDEA